MPRVLLLVAVLLGLVGPAAAQSSPLTAADRQAAIAYLQTNAPALGLAPQDAADLVVTAGHRSARSGIGYVYVQQRYAGIGVIGGQVTVALDRSGEVVHVAGGLVPGLASAASVHTWGFSVSQALKAAIAYLGAFGTPTTALAAGFGPDQFTTFGTIGGVPITGRLVYTPLPREGVALTWELQIPTPGADDVWVIRLDARTAAEVSRHDLVVTDLVGPAPPAEARSLAPFVEAMPAPELSARGVGRRVAGYTVYPLPYESPNHAPTPPPADGRTVVADPSDATASPFGWHDTDGVPGAEYTATWGNNVRAYNDRAADNTGTLADSPDGTASLTFDFPLDLTQAPVTYTDAAVTNLFYWNNIVHDVMAQYGFDSAAGNFQAHTYGAGGVGGDEVRAEAQDGSGLNGANMFTPPDGASPRMQMFEWSFTSPHTDSALDAGVIIHEYTHGTSNRLTGGPGNVSCLNNSEQMGEGWSDWFALMLTQESTHTGPQRRGIGTYILGQPTTGTGIRAHAYSTDFGENPFTYADTVTQPVPHGVGSVWATMLWDLTWALIDAHGYDPDVYNAAGTAGNQIALNLVTEGLKLQPCLPGFVDGRDAILAADALLYGSAHRDAIWAAFAGRGLGVSADQGSSASNGDNVEAFDLPITAGVVVIDPLSLAVEVAPDGTASADVTVSNTGAPGDGVVHFEAAVANLDQPDGQAPLPGGPDAFGHTFADSGQPGGPAVGFQDISGTGTVLTLVPAAELPAADEGYADVALPFPVPYYSAPQSTVRVSSNGFVAFSAFLGETYTNTALPSGVPPNAIVAPFWDDLEANDGGVLYAGTLPDGRFAIQWDDFERFSDPASSLTFQLIFAPNGDLEVQYAGMSSTTLQSATVGIERPDGADGLSIAFNEPFVASNKAFVVDAPLAWASVSPGAGTLAEGEATTLSVAVDAAGLPEGTYGGDVVITTNDPDAASTTVALTLTVASDGTVSIVIDGARGVRYLGPPAEGITVDDIAAQNLVRGVPGYYPTYPRPTLWTDYDAVAGTWLADNGAGYELPLAKAFRWYFLDRDGVGDPAVSESHALPFTLSTALPANHRQVRLALDTSGNRFNHLANPFGVDLDVTGIRDWQGGLGLSPNSDVYTYDDATGAWETATTVAPWQAFRFRAKGPRQNGQPRNLTIPTSAQAPLAGRTAPPATTRPQLAFALAATSETGRPLADRMLTVAFDGATAAFDIDEDVEKFQPPTTAYAMIGARAGGELLGHDARPFAAAEIELAIDARGARAEMTLSWDASTLPAGLPVVLVDLASGAEIDVRSRASYRFRAEARPALDDIPLADLADASAATDRFVLRIGSVLASAGEATAVSLDVPVPNPSNGVARLGFAIPEAGAVRLAVFDARGRTVAVLVDGSLAAGRHHASLPPLAAGVYVVRLEANGAVVTQRAAVVR